LYLYGKHDFVDERRNAIFLLYALEGGVGRAGVLLTCRRYVLL